MKNLILKSLFLASIGLAAAQTSTQPSNVDPDEDPNCNLWYVASDTDTCFTICKAAKTTITEFFTWNPDLENSCIVSAGRGFCVGVSAAATSSTSVTLTTSVTSTSSKSSATTAPLLITPSTLSVKLSSSSAILATSTAYTTLITSTLSKSLSKITAIPSTELTIKLTTTIASFTSPSSSSTSSKTTSVQSKPSSFVYDTTQFPPSAGTLQCIQPSSSNPSPISITSGSQLQSAITIACQQLVGASEFLEVGNAYTTTVVSDTQGQVTQFALQIKLGGFTVTQAFCISSLTAVLACPNTGTGSQLGGCSYTSDQNLQACIFPTSGTGSPVPAITGPGPRPTYDPSMFPPSSGQLQCVNPSSANPNPLAQTLSAQSITTACQNLVGSSKFLDIGLPYTTTVQLSPAPALEFEIQIKLGGFSVTEAFCVSSFTNLLSCQTGSPSSFMGGCSYSSDLNFEACAFPVIS